jgi:hypothetical protein
MYTLSNGVTNIEIFQKILQNGQFESNLYNKHWN